MKKKVFSIFAGTMLVFLTFLFFEAMAEAPGGGSSCGGDTCSWVQGGVGPNGVEWKCTGNGTDCYCGQANPTYYK